ncbi:D-malate degradation protein R [Legionella massiliensis]|uniref:D-malate degradation protein R n=1 Tax=Legionella massiliensis TaxID=1034943 RepID=A0A078KWX3_9GAMM|nr:LysR family transcriptional regulator [Legionella massiliensis]CDZ77451.1 D-malate degradation protein R [Legionella massiliensis]CEE13189.1 HTH-type transcriptional regulator DmlR [Legionella massiliensis]
MNTIALIQTFCKVVQARSFSVAARQLGISAAAVSKQVSLLEAQLGVSLLERTTRKVFLTSVGETYYFEVQKVLHALDEANNTVAISQAEPKGLLRVKSSRFFAEQIILARMPEFKRKYPELTLDLQIAEQVPHMLEEELDIVFGMSTQVASNSVQKKITTTRYVFCASPDYLEQYGHPEKPSDLQAHHYLTHSMRQPNNSWIFPSGETVYLEPILYLNDAAALCDSACRGLGIVALHHYQVAQALEQGSLVEILVNYAMPTIPVYLFYHPTRFMQPKVRVWIEEMSANLRSFM